MESQDDEESRMELDTQRRAMASFLFFTVAGLMIIRDGGTLEFGLGNDGHDSIVNHNHRETTSVFRCGLTVVIITQTRL